MSNPPRRRRLEVEEVGDVTVVNFVDRRILDEQNIQAIGEQLFSLVDELGRRKVVLNFGNVEYFSSAAFGKLITLNKKLHGAGGRLVLCEIDPEIWEAFIINRTSLYFEAYEKEQEALRVISRPVSDVLRVGCPRRACRGCARGLVDVPGSEASLRCLSCNARFRAQVPEVSKGGSAEAVVVGLCVEARAGLVMELVAGPPFTLTVGPRLDLYTADLLKQLVLTVPPPRRVLIDCSSTTEWSDRGAAVLAELARDPDSRVAVVVAPRAAAPPSLSDDITLFHSAEAAVPSLGANDPAGRPITVKVTRLSDPDPPAP
jgi:anti-sigma B factor antagonist